MSCSTSFSDFSNRVLVSGLELYKDALTLAHVAKESFQPSGMSSKPLTRLSVSAAAIALVGVVYSRLNFQTGCFSQGLQRNFTDSTSSTSSLSDYRIYEKLASNANYFFSPVIETMKPLPMSYESSKNKFMRKLTDAFSTKTNWFEKSVLFKNSNKPMWFETVKIIEALHKNGSTRHLNQLTGIIEEVKNMLGSLKVNWVNADKQSKFVSKAINMLNDGKLPADLKLALQDLEQRVKKILLKK